MVRAKRLRVSSNTAIANATFPVATHPTGVVRATEAATEHVLAGLPAPLAEPALVRGGVDVTRAAARVHAEGQIVGGIGPEVIYVDARDGPPISRGVRLYACRACRPSSAG